jgi:hypothetical protein
MFYMTFGAAAVFGGYKAKLWLEDQWQVFRYETAMRVVDEHLRQSDIEMDAKGVRKAPWEKLSSEQKALAVFSYQIRAESCEGSMVRIADLAEGPLKGNS